MHRLPVRKEPSFGPPHAPAPEPLSYTHVRRKHTHAPFPAPHQFNEDDRGFWAQSLEELMAAIAPHNAARVAPAAPSGDNHKPAAGSC
jgi:hypothetical protein